MNRTVNVQRSVSSQPPPATPPRRNHIYRHNDSALRRPQVGIRRSQQAAMTPQTLALPQANASAVHARLQQHHNRLQLQLQARPPPPTPAPVGPVKAFLDTTFRAYAARVQAEFNGLRAACARAVQREQRVAEHMRSTCAVLARERDAAEEKLRVLTERRAIAGKRTRQQMEREEQEERELEEMTLLYSPSPPQLPTSPPPRLLSPFVLAARRTPDAEDGTAFDLTVACDELPRPGKKRRVSEPKSFERTCVPTPSPSPHLRETIVTTERVTCCPVGAGESDMDLETDSESESDGKTSQFASQSASRSSSRYASPSPAAVVKPEFSTPPLPSAKPKARLDLEYVDIMYLPSGGKLLCRVCLLASNSAAADATTTKLPHGPIQAFAPGASWEALRTHSEEAHPEACADVVGLGRAGVRELRRRLGLGGSSSS
ncbi:hypothetical protein C8J57DRAFT_1239384 [Mycena rebaudengoi]|nr:hypothetical protein C8J57DRAFT_1239384 [Mycena rebaudengoi]